MAVVCISVLRDADVVVVWGWGMERRERERERERDRESKENVFSHTCIHTHVPCSWILYRDKGWSTSRRRLRPAVRRRAP